MNKSFGTTTIGKCLVHIIFPDILRLIVYIDFTKRTGDFEYAKNT